MCQHSWVFPEGFQRIQRHCGLWDEATPNIHGELSICDCQSHYKVIFPCSDGQLHCIYVMNVWGRQLLSDIFLFIIFIETRRCLIIHPIYLRSVFPVCWVFNFFGVRFHYVDSGPTLEVLFQNSVIIIYIHNKYILVASTGYYR